MWHTGKFAELEVTHAKSGKITSSELAPMRYLNPPRLIMRYINPFYLIMRFIELSGLRVRF
jgi:hypothetical protein